jgi:hypothetical protein
MTRLLYWIAYHLDLGPRLGSKVLDLAVRSWLQRSRHQAAQPLVRQETLGLFRTVDLGPSFGTDERL